MPKVGSNRDAKAQERKRPMPVNGKSVFLLRDLAAKPKRKPLRTARKR